MQQHPTTGVRGVKPRLKPAKEELPELSRKYLILRNRQMRIKTQEAAIAAAVRRGDLIEKKFCMLQASFLLVALRQKMLCAPDAWCRKILNLSEPAKAKAILKELMHSMLNEIKDLPRAVTDPNWLESLEKDGE